MALPTAQIDGVSNQIIYSVPFSTEPVSLAVNAITARIYVVQGDAVHVLDGTTNSVIKSLAVPGGPTNVVVDETRNRVYVGCSAGFVSVIEDDQLVPARPPIGAGTQSDGIDVDPTTGLVYVANFSSGNVAILAP